MAEPRDTRKLVALARLMVGVVVLWSLWLTYRQRHRHASGTVIVDGISFAVEGCKKVVGAEGSIGADIGGSDGNVLRVIRTGDDVQLWLYAKAPGGAAIPINRSDCSEWDVRVDRDYPGPLEVVGGDISVICTVGGRKLNGIAYFDHCPAK